MSLLGAAGPGRHVAGVEDSREESDAARLARERRATQTGLRIKGESIEPPVSRIRGGSAKQEDSHEESDGARRARDGRATLAGQGCAGSGQAVASGLFFSQNNNIFVDSSGGFCRLRQDFSFACGGLRRRFGADVRVIGLGGSR